MPRNFCHDVEKLNLGRVSEKVRAASGIISSIEPKLIDFEAVTSSASES